MWDNLDWRVTGYFESKRKACRSWESSLWWMKLCLLLCPYILGRVNNGKK